MIIFYLTFWLSAFEIFLFPKEVIKVLIPFLNVVPNCNHIFIKTYIKGD